MQVSAGYGLAQLCQARLRLGKLEAQLADLIGQLGFRRLALQ